jgi:hypothetical protein
MPQANLGRLKRRLQGQNKIAPLRGDDPTRGKASTIMIPLHGVLDRFGFTPRTHEIGVQGVRRSFGAGRLSRLESLSHHLPPEKAALACRLGLAPEAIGPEGAQCQERLKTPSELG